MKRVGCAESADSAGRAQGSRVAGDIVRAPPASPSGFSSTHEGLPSLHLAETFLCINKG